MKKWCVLGRHRQDVGSWSWVAILAADTAEEALNAALRQRDTHGYYVALPWEIAARAKTGLHFLDAEEDR
jgi:hypothetical protein